MHDVLASKNWAARLLTTDFCPWANRFVYWLKEPVGWFVLATVVSVIVGLYLAPIGWTLAAALASIIAVGMVWPAVAVRAVACRLSPSRQQVHEGDLCELQLAVRNRLPLPVWGLAVEGFLDRRQGSEDEDAVPTVALAYVRAMATSMYRFSMRPELRGRYPDGAAVLTCSFPFGIWTAKRQLKNVSPVTVWPKVYPVSGETAMTGRHAAETGEGNCNGLTGDFLGVREYRRGDCMRQVNWVATARSGELVVTQRGGPQCPSLNVILDVGWTAHPEQLTDRIRVAASVLANLHRSAIPLRVSLGKQRFQVRRGWDGFAQMMDALTDVPREGVKNGSSPRRSSERAAVTISSNPRGDVEVQICDPTRNHRLTDQHTHRVIRRDQNIAHQLHGFWTEGRDANLVA
ncbi:DUF58 domain-containing protein [Roseimaritima ulvae]|nr:DUF58 domain-containing protein [Roseimaritima ulvae]